MKHTSDKFDDNDLPYYARENALYEPEIFYNLGRNICISILDVWNKNPYSRITSTNEDRKEIAEKQAKIDRFRK